MSTATVFIVDDDVEVVRALARLLRASGYATREFTSAAEFLATHDPHAPGCLIFDLVMPDQDGFALQAAVKAMGSTQPVIFLTGRGSIPLTVTAIRAGAVNMLTKPVGQKQLLSAVAEALRIEADQRRAGDHVHEAAERLATLTPRERQVLEQVVCGRLNKQIAADLGTVEKTIKVHRARVMHKMGVRSLAALVRIAALLGISAECSRHTLSSYESAVPHRSHSPQRIEVWGSRQLPFGPMHSMSAGGKAADGGDC
jgi:FixJ family two-component response regulator